MSGLKKILVVPTYRPEQFQAFQAAWARKGPWGVVGDWDEIILIEDAPHQTFDPEVTEHHSWETIDAALGPDSWIISRQDSAIRCFGFLRAFQRGATHVLTLDDDVRPYGGIGNEYPIFKGHLEALAGHRRWVKSTQGKRTRGLPYLDLGDLETVVANVGLWAGVPDLDAPQQLLFPTSNYQPPLGSRIVAAGQYVPVCGMNLCLTREALPLAYFPLMGQNQPYRRFDDIWFGIIMKRILDHLRLHLSAGEPFVRHERASDPIANLVKEAPGIAANEYFWRYIDGMQLTATTPAACMRELGSLLVVATDPYISRLGEALQVWSGNGRWADNEQKMPFAMRASS